MSEKKEIQKEDKIVSQDIEFLLTEPEYAEKGREAAERSRELGVLNLQFEREKKKFKSQIELKSDELNTILSVIQAGKETRNVECVEHKDYDRHMMVYIHRGEVVFERVMEQSERQVELIVTRKESDQEKMKKHLGSTDYPPEEEKSHINMTDLKETMREERSKNKRDLCT